MDHPSTKNKLTAFQWIFSYFFLSLEEIPFFLDLRRWSLQTDLATTTVHCCVLLDFQNYWGLFTLELLKHIKLFLTEFPTLSYWDHWVLLRAAAPGSCESISVSDGEAARQSLRARRRNVALRALTFSSSFAHRALIKLGLRVRKLPEIPLVMAIQTDIIFAHCFFNNLDWQRPLLRDTGVQQMLTFSPRWSQDFPKMAPRWSQDGWSQDGPRMVP